MSLLDRITTEGSQRVTTDGADRIICGIIIDGVPAPTVLINIFGSLLASQAALNRGDSTPHNLLPLRS